MEKSKGNYEYDSSESDDDDDSSDDNAPIQPQKVNPKVEKNGVNEKASGSRSNNATAFSKSANPKIHPAVKSIPFKPAPTKPPTAKVAVQKSSEDEEDETDSDDDIAEIQKPKNGGVAKNTVNRQSSAVSNNSKIYPAVKSIPFKPAIKKSSNTGGMVEEEDETNSSLDYDDDDRIRPKNVDIVKSTVARQASKVSSTSNNSKIHTAIKSIPFKLATELKTDKTVTVSSEDESDPTSSDDEVNEGAVSKLPPKINNGTTNNTFVSSSSKKSNNDKAANKILKEESDETSDTSESDKTSSDDDDDDASDEEEEDSEADDKQKDPPPKNAPGHAVKKPESTVTQSNHATFTLSKNDETDDDYTSSEDEVFANKPLTAKPFQTDSESEEPDYSDDSSEDDMIPLKNNQNIASKNVIPPKDIGARSLPKYQPKIAAPFQNPFPPIRTTSTVYQKASQQPTVSQGSTSFTAKQESKVTVTFQNPFPPVLAAATVSRASIQPLSSVTRQQPTVSSNIKQPQKTSEEDDLLLNALQQFSLNLSNPEERQKELERRAEEALRRNELTFVCCVCFENYYRSSNFVKCKKLNGEKTKHDHYICITCLRGTATPENAGIAPDGSGLKCPFQECQNILLMSEIRGLIDAGVEANLLDLIGRMSLASADIGILVTCPGCQKQWIVEDKGKPSYVCECKRKNCLFCEREYDKFHEGRNCLEAAAAAAAEIKTKKQNEVALEMNNIIVRVCHKCGLQFVKSEGCNKMTCRCKATQCYICRERDVDYGHFGGPCQLYDDAEAYDRRRLEEVIAKNKNAPM